MHTQLSFSGLGAARIDEVIAILSDWGFDGFEEKENLLLAVIPTELANQLDWPLLQTTIGAAFTREDLEEQNWNAIWESNFEPVFVDDFLCIRADFHAPATNVEYELIITPKMSFGTGHHATTWLMARAMRELNWQAGNIRRVFDFGTGTGVLAILAAKLGATDVLAIDNDKWSIENTRENMERNGETGLQLYLADRVETEGQGFDLILANINKHIILENMPALAKRLNPGGILLLSGLLLSDEADILLAASVQGLKPEGRSDRDNWLCLKLSAGSGQ